MTRKVPESEEEKQIYYRDARSKGYYGEIWTTTGKCVFCDLRDKYILFEEAGMVLVVSLYAYIDGDLMIVSRRHIQSASEMTAEEWEATRKLMHISRKMIKKTYSIKGLNFVQRHGGPETQSTVVGHYHIKVIPFDAPDLVTWHYRDLENTPLENIALLKKHRKHLIEQSVKFDQKYSDEQPARQYAEVRILIDGKVLVDADENLPGVYLDPTTKMQPKQQVAHKLEQLYGLQIADLTLVGSSFAETTEVLKEEHLKVTYPIRKLLHVERYSATCKSKPDGFKWISAELTDE